MSSLSEKITASAERVFDSGGFAASGMDALTQAAGVSTRTLYKHIGSKSDLIAAVLRIRSTRFFERLDVVDDVDGLFAALEQWVQSEGARGCLFLRAAGELSAEFPAALEEVSKYRRRLRELINKLVQQEGEACSDLLTDQVLVLFEGATSAASYRGLPAVSAARSAAAMLMRCA